MNNTHLLEDSTAIVCKYYIFQRKIVEYKVCIKIILKVLFSN